MLRLFVSSPVYWVSQGFWTIQFNWSFSMLVKFHREMAQYPLLPLGLEKTGGQKFLTLSNCV
jgi:hypothetical protein